MKIKFSRITKISFIIFLALIVTAASFAYPLYRYVEKSIDSKTEKLVNLLTSKAGIEIQYDSLSPSIFSYFYIHNITVNNLDGEKIASIKSTRLTYKITSLFKGDISSFLRSVYIDGVSIELEKLMEFASQFALENATQKATEESGDEENAFSILDLDFSLIKSFIPASVTVKNVSLEYENKALDAKLNLKSISLTNSRRKENLELLLNGSASALIKNTGAEFNGRVGITGNVFQNLDNSTLQLQLSDLTNGSVYLNRINLLATYNQQTVEIHTIQSVLPLSINAFYDMQKNTFDASIKTQNLSPVSLVSSVANKSELAKFSNLRVSLDAQANCDVAALTGNLTGETTSNSKPLSYSVKASAYIPDEVLSGQALVDLNLYGNDKKLNLDHLTVEGGNFNGEMSLSFIFDTFQASGFADLQNYTLPNGTSISTELYFDPLEKGFMLFSPQIFIGEKALTALQLSILPQKDSYDFEFEVSDYSHIQSDERGLIKIDGSYMNDSNYVQTNVVLNRIYADTVAGIASQLMDESTAKQIDSMNSYLEPYVLSGDLYFSTDFKSVSYNIPYVIAANTGNKVQYLMISGNGNEQQLQLNQLSLILGQYAVTASASIDSIKDSNELFFDSDIIAGSVPYHFSGVFMPQVLNLTGTYGTSLEVRFDKNNVNASLVMESLPVVAGPLSLIFSTDCSFTYTPQNGPEFLLTRFELEEASSAAPVNPKLIFTANATKYGAQINSISYSDQYSVLNGSADLALNINDSIFESAVLNGNVKNHFSDEEIVIDASISNPELEPLTPDSILKSFYLNSQIDIKSFGLSRFTKSNNINDEITASVNLSGTLEHPFVSVNVNSLGLFVGTEVINGNGVVFLEDRDITVDNFEISGQAWNLNKLKGSFQLEQMTGAFTAGIYAGAMGKDVEIPLNIDFTDSYIPDGSLIPESMMISVKSSGMKGSFVRKTVPFSLNLMMAKDMVSIYSSDNIGLYGTFMNNGDVSASIRTADFLSAEFTGNFNSSPMNLKFNNINCNIPKLLSYFALEDLIQFDSGIVKGYVGMSGTMISPEFNGALSISDVDMTVPMAIPYPITTDKILITIVNSEANIYNADFLVKNKNPFSISCKIAMNQWFLDYMDIKLVTPEKSQVPLKLQLPFLKLEGETAFDLKLYFENNIFDVDGSVFFEKFGVMFDVTKLSSTEMTMAANTGSSSNANAAAEVGIRTNLSVRFGTHANLNINPLMRCILVPDTHALVKIDSNSDLYEIDGQIKIKSGDISYLNRNFYIKEGSLKFNPDDIMNMLVTIRAETRERDENNQTVRIILSAENQSILSFNPVYSSIPAKSDAQIRSLLGQIVLGDAENASDFLLSASDYVLQSAVMRNIENKLRDSLNFDIFSVRTNILQNTLNSVTGNVFNSNGTATNNPFTMGNLLDNSTVYIGKYFGSVLYVDAMLHLAAQNPTSVLNGNDITRLSFKPEFGMELELPVVNIRWDMAPDIDALLRQQYVPSTSLTVSWKFSF